MKSPKEDYEIRKSVVSDPGTGEDLPSSSPFIHSLFNMYLYLEAINVLLNYTHLANRANTPNIWGIFFFNRKVNWEKYLSRKYIPLSSIPRGGTPSLEDLSDPPHTRLCNRCLRSPCNILSCN